MSSTMISPADLRRFADRSIALPGDRAVLADMLEDLGRADMGAAIRAGRPWRTFLGCTVFAVQPESERRAPTLGTWIDGTPIEWECAGPFGSCWYITTGEGRDERPLELRWDVAGEAAVLAKRDSLIDE